MRDYKKPLIEDEFIDIEDICAVSGGTSAGNADSSGQSGDLGDLWGALKD